MGKGSSGIRIAQIRWIVAVVFFVLIAGGCSFFGRRQASPADPQTARQVHEVRQATERYRDVQRAEADGYFRSSGYIPSVGYQFANPKFFSSFDIRRPPILLYDERDGKMELTGVGFLTPFDKNPKSLLPFRNAEYMKHPAECHYKDGTVVDKAKEAECPKAHPITEAALGLWHPDLWVMSAWVWYPNPNGLFSLNNPLLNLGS